MTITSLNATDTLETINTDFFSSTILLPEYEVSAAMNSISSKCNCSLYMLYNNLNVFVLHCPVATDKRRQ